MPTLLLQCVAPLQAWGTQSHFSVRDTGREPSKSGVIGLLCAALGRPRTAPIDDLARLRFGVRVDCEGQILRDYHTAGQGGYLTADGKSVSQSTILSNRYYLTDAAFLVGLEGQTEDEPLLKELHTALANPHWMLFLGRKACPPGRPVCLPDGWREQSLLEALHTYPWLGTNEALYQELNQLRLVVDDETGPEVRQDTPLSFEKGHRQFAQRRLSTHFVHPLPNFHPNLTKKEIVSS